MNSSIYRLASVHSKLDDEIRRESRRRLPDAFRIQRLKKLRLAIKDKLHNRAGSILAA